MIEYLSINGVDKENIVAPKLVYEKNFLYTPNLVHDIQKKNLRVKKATASY